MPPDDTPSDPRYVLTEGRRRNMRAIRRRDTRRELAVRRALHRMGYRFRVDLRLRVSERWVRPDVVFTRRKVAVFLDGCAFHGCPAHGMKPRVNREYWEPKLRRNLERDRLADAALDRAGWTVVRRFEHVDLDEVISDIVTAVGPPRL